MSSFMRGMASRPAADTAIPKILKNSRQRPCRVSPSNRPKMTSMDIRGRMARTLSTRPRFPLSVMSVT